MNVENYLIAFVVAVLLLGGWIWLSKDRGTL